MDSPAPEAETAWLRAVARGDRRAFERIFRAHKDAVLSLALQRTGDLAEAEDVVHDVFVAVARRAGGIRLTGSLRAYLTHACVNRARELARRRRLEPELDPKLDKGACASQGGSEQPSERAERGDELAAVRTAMASLPPEQSEVVGLHLAGGLTFREIAEQLSLSINTAQSRYRYGLEALRRKLETKGVTP